MSTLCFSFVSCGDDNDEPKADEENYTLLCTAMIPHGLLKVGTVDFFALNPETGKESGFNLPDNYGNDCGWSANDISICRYKKDFFWQRPFEILYPLHRG